MSNLFFSNNVFESCLLLMHLNEYSIYRVKSLNVTQRMIFVLDRVENIVRNEENSVTTIIRILLNPLPDDKF